MEIVQHGHPLIIKRVLIPLFFMIEIPILAGYKRYCWFN